MLGKPLSSRLIKIASASALVAAMTLTGASMAVATSNSLSSGTAITSPSFQGFADIVEQVRPTVVSIEVAGKVSAVPSEMEGTPFEEFFERFSDEMKRRFGSAPRGHGERQSPMPNETRAAGSGVIVDADGYIVTNNHVVEDGREILVTLDSGKTYDAELVGRDPKTDLALIHIDADEDLSVASFGDSGAVRVGDWVIAIGNPFGLDNTVTLGIVSSRGRGIGAGPYDDFLQIDASINQGNSGGPAVNTKGEVIGVNTAIFSPSGGNIGIGFAIPANMVQEVVADLKEHGEVKRGWLGVHIQDVTEDLAEGLGLPAAQGAIVAEVVPAGPASNAGFEQGDVIIAVNGESVETVRDLPRMIAELDSGESAEITIWRRGKEQTLKAKIGSFPKAEQIATVDDVESASDQEVLGMKLAMLGPSTRSSYDIDEDMGGVVVTDVEADSWASRKGLTPGDVILKVDFDKVMSPKDVVAAIDAAEKNEKRTVLFLVSREAQERFVALPLRDA
jgi:serine protease Do